MQIISAGLVGLIFGLGLILSGMINPTKVIGFLDLTGAWDPSLGLVMGGAMAVAALAFRWVKGHTRSLLGAPLQIPQSRVLDKRLVFGSLAFGAGWGLAGFCPGPALVSLTAGSVSALVFVAAMLLGMALFEYVLRPR